jgi:hypothetical protein
MGPALRRDDDQVIYNIVFVEFYRLSAGTERGASTQPSAIGLQPPQAGIHGCHGHRPPPVWSGIKEGLSSEGDAVS